MNFTLNLLEFYNLGVFFLMLFLDASKTHVNIYVFLYLLISWGDSFFARLGIDKLYLNVIYSLLIFRPFSLMRNDLSIVLNLQHFDMTVIIFGLLECASQIYNKGDVLQIKMIHLYLQVMFIVILTLILID